MVCSTVTLSGRVETHQQRRQARQPLLLRLVSKHVIATCNLPFPAAWPQALRT